jgi:hypothetical protein
MRHAAVLRLHDQTDHRIGRSIRKKRPIQRNAKMENKTSEYNWASKSDESQVESTEVIAGGVAAKT